MQRNLAAVLAADMVGYSRQMSENAERTLADLRRLRTELFGPLVAGHRGRVIKSMGDGWIVTFASAADAVTCAMRIQDKLVLEPDVRLRIGVHLGDVTDEDGDVYGDAVNVAARLEALASPGGLAISDVVYSTLDGTLRPAFDAAGAHRLKNLSEPLAIWTRGGLVGAAETREHQRKAGFPVLEIVPVAVPAQSAVLQDMADSITHDVAAYLADTSWLRCAIRTRPGIAHVLTSKLRESGGRLRLESRLVAPDGEMLWSGKQDGNLADGFDWQDAAGAELAGKVLGTLLERQSAEVGARSESAMTAQDWLLKSFAVSTGDRRSFERGLPGIEKAIALAPDWAYPYEVGAATLAACASIGFDDILARYADRQRLWLERAITLSQGSTASRAILAYSRYCSSGDADTARSDLNGFLRDLPFDLLALTYAGYLFVFLGEPRGAMDCFRRFEAVGRLNPLAPTVKAGIAAALAETGRFDEAVAAAEDSIRNLPGFPPAYRWKAAALAQLGRLDEARATLARHGQLSPNATISSVRLGSRYVDTPETRIYFDGLRLAGMPE